MDDIRVYWIESDDSYVIMIDTVEGWCAKLHTRRDNEYDYHALTIGRFKEIHRDHELVYDSAESSDMEFTLIDDNLRIPMVIDICEVSLDDECKWDNNDHAVWNNGLFEHYIYHEERTA